uniref:Uncharacterized protein n=1 Tax=Angiostrongylus cantonensis TaxID=6313 RepID=A0A0K0DNY3_ANGCA
MEQPPPVDPLRKELLYLLCHPYPNIKFLLLSISIALFLAYLRVFFITGTSVFKDFIAIVDFCATIEFFTKTLEDVMLKEFLERAEPNRLLSHASRENGRYEIQLRFDVPWEKFCEAGVRCEAIVGHQCCHLLLLDVGILQGKLRKMLAQNCTRRCVDSSSLASFEEMPSSIGSNIIYNSNGEGSETLQRIEKPKLGEKWGNNAQELKNLQHDAMLAGRPVQSVIEEAQPVMFQSNSRLSSERRLPDLEAPEKHRVLTKSVNKTSLAMLEALAFLESTQGKHAIDIKQLSLLVGIMTESTTITTRHPGTSQSSTSRLTIQNKFISSLVEA